VCVSDGNNYHIGASRELLNPYYTHYLVDELFLDVVRCNHTQSACATRQEDEHAKSYIRLG